VVGDDDGWWWWWCWWRRWRWRWLLVVVGGGVRVERWLGDSVWLRTASFIRKFACTRAGNRTETLLIFPLASSSPSKNIEIREMGVAALTGVAAGERLLVPAILRGSWRRRWRRRRRRWRRRRRRWRRRRPGRGEKRREEKRREEKRREEKGGEERRGEERRRARLIFSYLLIT
jgi:hypothetical protein